MWDFIFSGFMTKTIEGFSKLSKQEKINWVTDTYFSDSPESSKVVLAQYLNSDEQLQKLHDEFIENTITNFYLPFGVAPNFIINDKVVTIPMVIEESSVVAAASKAAKYWSKRGGFKAEVLATEKIGQVHFLYREDKVDLEAFFTNHRDKIITFTDDITANMRKRGGGILDVELRDKTNQLDNYYQLHVTFDTKDSMGANFINSCLERMADYLKEHIEVEVVMSILSNYVPNCVVRASVSCPVEKLAGGQAYAEKFIAAIKIAEVEPHRAVTHNKGIMNGIDAVVLATGNDFRAIESGVHAYAAKEGQYTSLSHAKIENGIFSYWLDVPLAVGTVGGLTSLHPLVKFALGMLENPNAQRLMEIIAVAGLAQNFAALNSLTTTGIQKGHMKMHLKNMLNQLKATSEESEQAIAHFENKTITHYKVVDYIEQLRAK